MMPEPDAYEPACQRIYHAGPQHVLARAYQRSAGAEAWWDGFCERISAMGFDSFLLPPLWTTREEAGPIVPDDPDQSAAPGYASLPMEEALRELAKAAARHELALLVDLQLDSVAARGAWASRYPEWYADAHGAALDPRRDLQTGIAKVKLREGKASTAFIAAWADRLNAWLTAGVYGFRCRRPGGLSGEDWNDLIAQVHARHPDACFMAWTPGMSPGELDALSGAGFEATFLSLPWWDYRASWLVEEHDRLRALAPIIAPVSDIDSAPAAAAHGGPSREEQLRSLWTAAIAGDGVVMPMGLEDRIGSAAIVEVNRWLAERSSYGHRLQQLSGQAAGMTALFRAGPAPQLLLVNPDTERDIEVDWGMLNARMPGSYTVAERADRKRPERLPPAGYALVEPTASVPVKLVGHLSGDKRKSVTAAMRGPRIAIERVSPAVDHGQFPVKCTVGDTLHVQADVFMDGHEDIAVALLWRAADESQWRRVPMKLLENDRWEGVFSPDRIGPHCYTVQAWHDVWHTYCDRLQKKSAAGQDVSLEVEEGRGMLAEALERARSLDVNSAADVLARCLRDIGPPQTPLPLPKARRLKAGGPEAVDVRAIPTADPVQVRTLLNEHLAHAMEEVDVHAFEVSDIVYPLTVDRREARFASWYELFPRSQSATPGKHGTFLDVVERLPAIRDMGFDVLYFPPIHPIGLRNRKGKNNALQAGPGDPGSPYAIGSPEGGHDAVHPELGTLDDFSQLVREARRHDLEIAMDFAIQCSPDHPWLAEHPEWFDWRADGSLRYAENPPKRYEDIVNPDFYNKAASQQKQAGLWRALRDVILFWVDQGVKTFRVDNPHTKPLPFWQWMIAEVQGAHPDVLFLSEAFTRPKMMYRLAKVGFSQSYTYFTWRNDKQELTDYLAELNTPPVADFFRPNFFVNTPDINPVFLQRSGRAGFLIRAALAATLSGLWGVYNGFELCEADSIPGKEEYLDSEKYELRSWDWNRPGNIIAEVTRLNQIRRTNPALQSHLGLRFHRVDNDRILFFSKATREHDNIVLVAISLDPHAMQAGTLELPLWQWNMTETGAIPIHELYADQRFSLYGKHHYIELSPDRPFLLWRLAHGR
jgi:starch synthase (maltosyl-transferring)